MSGFGSPNKRSDDVDPFAGTRLGEEQGALPRTGRGRQPGRPGIPPDEKGTLSALRLPHPDWLRHELTISGTTDAMAAFAQAACGAGGIPWEYPNIDFEEDDRVLALVRPPDGSRGLDLASARILALELREATLACRNKITAAADQCWSCPFDLHALLPVPPQILQLGADHPASISWLQANWGTTWPLRHVQRVPRKSDGRKRKTVQMTLEFWAADWTPWAALATIKQNWPAIRLEIRPIYDNA